MMRTYDAVWDSGVAAKQVHVSPRLWDDHIDSPAQPGDPVLLVHGRDSTVAELTVDESLTDLSLHFDPITGMNLGLTTEEGVDTLDMEAIPYTEADSLLVTNLDEPTTALQNNPGFFVDTLAQQLAGRYLLLGDETVVPYEGGSARFQIVDAHPPNESVVRITNTTQFELNLRSSQNQSPTDQPPSTPNRDASQLPMNASAQQSEQEPEYETFDAVTFEDVGGLTDEIRKIREVVERPLTDPDAFQGVPTPSGVLLHGPPGTGKTMLAKAVATEVDAAFFEISGAEIFDKNYGQSEENLRELFATAEENQPAIIFIDEFDAIAPSRDNLSSGNQVERRVVTQLKTLMDGFTDDRTIVLGATNHPDEIDDAFLRPGRFDRLLEVGVPTADARREILQIHTRDMRLKCGDSTLDVLVDQTTGYTGADISDLCMKANMHMQRRLLDSYDEYTSVSTILAEEDAGYRPEDFDAALEETKPTLLEKFDVDVPSVTWTDVGGHDTVKRDLRESVDGPLKAPHLWNDDERASGALLFGPPGTGKTLLAKAMATESDRVFIGLQATELKSKYVGETERNIRQVFTLAKQLEPAILYIDEIEAIARKRGEQTTDAGVSDAATSQLLSELDGIEERGDVIVVGSTNAEYSSEAPLQQQEVQFGLDPALLRPGRLDSHFHVPKPDTEGRQDIFDIHLDNITDSVTSLAEDVDVSALAEQTDGMSGADIEGLCWDAKQRARREVIDEAETFEEIPADATITVTHDDLTTALAEYDPEAPTTATATPGMFN